MPGVRGAVRGVEGAVPGVGGVAPGVRGAVRGVEGVAPGVRGVAPDAGRRMSGVEGVTRPEWAPAWSRRSAVFAARAASAGGTPVAVSRHISSSTAMSAARQRRCRPPSRSAGPSP
ncbi:hypothetical protein [Streptomyces sp. NPDC058812]|uniref:hypothetical protein n=1 Tax=Streptomyces sp. NPDC058812 TaxID=3346639 RepID=UPI00369C0261